MELKELLKNTVKSLNNEFIQILKKDKISTILILEIIEEANNEVIEDLKLHLYKGE